MRFQILRISMYFVNGHEAEKDPNLESRRGRVSYHHGPMEVEDVLKRHIDGEYEVQEDKQTVQVKRRERGRLLVAGTTFSALLEIHT